MELLKQILEMEDNEDPEKHDSLYIALHYQFKGKLSARLFEVENCKKYYQVASDVFVRANDGKNSLIMQSYYQFLIDDFSDLNLMEECLETNRAYKKLLKREYGEENIFYIAYTIDIVAQEIQTKPMKAFHKI